ncbi:PREDICTED: uncharacterized protein LOC106810190 [Priapulus caudatus]|uniref:Uncharacterized protein LOC106810190 n=1 Tax=Priapulus caudatus TaxID=37621 RepID=A0ABM1E9T5_PRICU|nr:PREDICTED: uncharacterized protein LOC106810190 [Priapulus caudatus]
MLGRVLIHTWIPFTSQQFGVDYCSVDCCVGDCGYTREETEMAVMKSALPSIAIPEPDNLACYIMKGFHGYGNRAALITPAQVRVHLHKQHVNYAEMSRQRPEQAMFCRATWLAI